MTRRITYLTTGLARAGAETQVLLLCEAFHGAGWEVSVISLLKPEAYTDELEALRIPVISLNLSKRVPNPLAFYRLVLALRSLKPDVVHCHQVHANLAGRAARLFTAIPTLICTAHSVTEGARWRDWAYRLTDSLCDLTTNVCRAGVDRYVDVGAVPASKIRFLPNAIDVTRYMMPKTPRAVMRNSFGIPADGFLWVAAGNLRAAKDYPTMIEAFRLLSEWEPSTRLIIAGSGSLAESLSAEIDQKGITGVRFLGTRTDVPDLLCAADGFVMSSAWEGTPLALLEAAASSLPIVATQVGGIAEVVADGESGFLVPPGAPSKLAQACLQVMRASPDQRAAWGSNGKMIVDEGFSLGTVVALWRALYLDVKGSVPATRDEAEGRVKIVHILGDSQYGGAAKSILRLAQIWEHSGWEVRLLTTDPQFQAAASVCGIATAHVECVWRAIRPVRDLLGLYRLWRYLRAERFTVAHTHTTKAGFVGRIAARMAGVPVVIHTVHGFAFHERSSKAKIAAYSVLEKIAGWFCDRIITVSEFHRSWALRLHMAASEKIVAIPNGIPDSGVASRESRELLRTSLGVDDEVLIFTPGRVVAEKGLEELIGAVGSLPEGIKQGIRVVIAGDGALLPALRDRVCELRLDGCVRFLGFRDDIPGLLGACDIVALPSWREGLSIALLESMCAGKAIIASNIGSNREALSASEDNGQAAVFVDPGDVPSLTQAIMRLAADAILRESLGRRARALYESRYTADRTLSAHKQTYLEILTLHGRLTTKPSAISAGTPQ